MPALNISVPIPPNFLADAETRPTFLIESFMQGDLLAYRISLHETEHNSKNMLCVILNYFVWVPLI